MQKTMRRIRPDIYTDYFAWILSQIGDWGIYECQQYENLLWQMYETPFQALIDMDENRIRDGMDLRQRFGREVGYAACAIDREFRYKPCGILEMMAALCLRCEIHIMFDPDIGNRTGKWFFEMIKSLGLDDMTDTAYDEQNVSYILDRFVQRRYLPNGHGGLFTLNVGRDLRAMEIWSQAMLYFTNLCERR